jgi:DNA repair photolyase
MKAKTKPNPGHRKVNRSAVKRVTEAAGSNKNAGKAIPGTRSVGKVYRTTRRIGITKTPEFGKKGLAQYAVNVGTRCGHQCLYCSSNTILRCHRSFKDFGVNPFAFGYAIVDPKTPERVARDADRLMDRGLIELCTTSDAWSPEAQRYELGRRSLAAILSHAAWEVRILTKNSAVQKDFGLIAEHRTRVAVGLSLTGTPRQEEILKIIERNASPISHRMAAMQQAHRLGLRTYGMLCPLLPGIADDTETVNELVRFCLDNGAEEIFAEAVNSRGKGLLLCSEALKKAGFDKEAAAMDAVRNRKNWSEYAARLLKTLQDVMTSHGTMDKLRYLLYSDNLATRDLAAIKKNDAGVKWLSK